MDSGWPCKEWAKAESSHAAAGHRAVVVFEPVVDDNPGDIFAGVAGEQTDFGKLAAQRDKLSAQKTAALAFRHFWESKFEVAHADGAEAAVNVVDG